MNIKDFTIGQIVYLHCVGIDVRRYMKKDDGLFDERKFVKKATVTAIGRKYITVVEDDRNSEIKFDINDDFRQKTDYSIDYKLYATEQSVLDNIEAESLYKDIHEKFEDYCNNNRYTLEQLKAISEILDEGK